MSVHWKQKKATQGTENLTDFQLARREAADRRREQSREEAKEAKREIFRTKVATGADAVMARLDAGEVVCSKEGDDPNLWAATCREVIRRIKATTGYH
jgi:hypothetical protein